MTTKYGATIDTNQTQNAEYIVMSDEELMKEYKHLAEDKGINNVSEWALPNSSEETDEDAVGEAMANENVENLVDSLLGVFRKII